MSKKSESADAVGDTDYDNPLLGELLAGLRRNGGRTADETASVNPEHHRQPLIGGFRRTPDVQIQAVFTGRGTLSFPRTAALHASGCIGLSVTHSGPLRGWLRRAPPQISD